MFVVIRYYDTGEISKGLYRAKRFELFNLLARAIHLFENGNTFIGFTKCYEEILFWFRGADIAACREGLFWNPMDNLEYRELAEGIVESVANTIECKANQYAKELGLNDIRIQINENGLVLKIDNRYLKITLRSFKFNRESSKAFGDTISFIVYPSIFDELKEVLQLIALSHRYQDLLQQLAAFNN